VRGLWPKAPGGVSLHLSYLWRKLLLRPRAPKVHTSETGTGAQTPTRQIGINPVRRHPSSLKVYLSVPMIANRALPRAELMAKAIRDSGNEVSSPWVLGPVEHVGPTMVNVFSRDKKGAEDCDTLVADVTEPSIGVGMEIMAAYQARRRIILVVKEGKATSRMLSQMDGKETLEYSADAEVYLGLLHLLNPPPAVSEKSI